MEPPPASGAKLSLESLSKDELVIKYKGLLGIAKKAKQAKDELVEENRKLNEQLKQHEIQKEADKNALMTMKEMLEAYTENKLQLTTQLSEIQKQRKKEIQQIQEMSIENESLKRQVARLAKENDELLRDMDKIEKDANNGNNLLGELKNTTSACEKLQQANADLRDSLNALKEKYDHVKNINSEQRQKFNGLKDRFLEVLKKLKKLKECKRILLETQHEYADSVTQWQREIIKASNLLCKELNELKLENARLLNKNEHSVIQPPPGEINLVTAQRLQDLLEVSLRAKKEYENLQQQNSQLKLNLEDVTSKSKSVKNSTKEIMTSNEGIHLTNKEDCNNVKVIEDKLSTSNVVGLLQRLQHLYGLAEKASLEYKQKTEELETVRQDFETLQNKITNVSNKDDIVGENFNTDLDSITSLKEQITILKTSSEQYLHLYQQKEREHFELLDEMRELNEALKARGDLISRQQEDLQQLNLELSSKTDELQQLQKQIEEKEHVLGVKEQTLECYSKDATAKIQDMENTILSKEENIRILSVELNGLRNVQCSPLDLDNQSDTMSTSTISKTDEVLRLKDVDESFEEKYNKMRILAAKLKKKLQDETVQKQQVEKTSSKELSEGEIKTQMIEMQKNMLELESLREQMLIKQKQIDTLKTENQKLKSSRKQTNVLNLEIEAAEKSLTEVTNKLAVRTADLEAANESVKQKESAIAQLRKQIQVLESATQAEAKHSKDLKDQIDHLQTNLKDANHSKQQAFDKVKDLEAIIENLKSELDSIKIDYMNSTKDQQRAISSLEEEKDRLSLQLSSVQRNLSESEQKLEHSERLAQDLKAEYLDYKIKAQAVLRKNQGRDSSKEMELEEELIHLRTSQIQLKSANETLLLRAQTIEKEKEQLDVENSRIKERIIELMQAIDEMRLQNDALNQDVQRHVQQQHELLKQHREQIEAINVCHKENVESLKKSYQRQLEQLSLEQIRNPSDALKNILHNDQLRRTDEPKFDVSLMEREDAEGSEEVTATLASLAASRKISNASSSNGKRHQGFMPLEELLNTPINSINSETLLNTALDNTDSINNNADLLHLELKSTKDVLHQQESRIRHLTALLAENEQDLAKLTQMNDMLKEELRRQERSVEREQHMHNSEYIKNVILKFLTLNNTDEKTRLVPVLNTLLKLSRNETELLNCVAKGQKVSDSPTARSSTWGSLLSWGGSGNNHN